MPYGRRCAFFGRLKNLGPPLRRVVGTARSFGITLALHDLPLRAINRTIQFYILKGMALVPETINPALVEPGRFRAGFARREELLASALAEYDMTPQFVEEALAQGDECFTLHDGDRLAGFSWFSRRPTLVLDGLVIHLHPGGICSYKGFTHPDYRGERVFGIVLSLALQSYTARGWRGTLGFVRTNNFRSRRSVDRAGWRPVGRLFVGRLLGRPMGWATPGCKPYFVRLESIAGGDR